MKRENRNTPATGPNILEKSTRPDKALTGNIPLGDAWTAPCPGCGRLVPEVAEAVRKHERFLRRLLAEQEDFQQSLVIAIHDSLAQRLAGALLYFEGARLQENTSGNDARDNYRIGLELLRQCIEEARRIAGQMGPPFCGDGAVLVGIEYLVHQMRTCDGPKIALKTQGDIDGIAPEMGNAVFRILSELLTNACSHSGSKQVRVRVVRTADRLELEVEDWGVGFDSTKTTNEAFGLELVRQRATLLGGDMIVDSAPGEGTRIIVRLPIHDSPLPAEER